MTINIYFYAQDATVMALSCASVTDVLHVVEALVVAYHARAIEITNFPSQRARDIVANALKESDHLSGDWWNSTNVATDINWIQVK